MGWLGSGEPGALFFIFLTRNGLGTDFQVLNNLQNISTTHYFQGLGHAPTHHLWCHAPLFGRGVWGAEAPTSHILHGMHHVAKHLILLLKCTAQARFFDLLLGRLTRIWRTWCSIFHFLTGDGLGTDLQVLNPQQNISTIPHFQRFGHSPAHHLWCHAPPFFAHSCTLHIGRHGIHNFCTQHSPSNSLSLRTGCCPGTLFLLMGESGSVEPGVSFFYFSDWEWSGGIISSSPHSAKHRH